MNYGLPSPVEDLLIATGLLVWGGVGIWFIAVGFIHLVARALPTRRELRVVSGEEGNEGRTLHLLPSPTGPSPEATPTFHSRARY